MALCKESGMEYFVNCVRKLIRIWFEEEKHDNVTRKMEAYIMTGGVFGTTETKVQARKSKTKGNVKYFFQRVFIPYKEFCASYPELEKWPALYPYYAIRRWFKIFNKQIAKNAVQEIKINHNVQREDVDNLRRLFLELKI